MRVILATANPGKQREFATLLAPRGFELVLQSEMGIVSVDETGNTFEDNALAERTFGKEFCDIYVKQKTKEWEHGFYRVGAEERAEMLDFV